jgi:hypothetical protein
MEQLPVLKAKFKKCIDISKWQGRNAAFQFDIRN